MFPVGALDYYYNYLESTARASLLHIHTLNRPLKVLLPYATTLRAPNRNRAKAKIQFYSLLVLCKVEYNHKTWTIYISDITGQTLEV